MKYSFKLTLFVIAVIIVVAVGTVTNLISASDYSHLFSNSQGHIKVVLLSPEETVEAQQKQQEEKKSLSVSSQRKQQQQGEGENQENINNNVNGDDSDDDESAFPTDLSRLVPIALANGSQYRCHIPPRVSTKASDRLWRSHLRRLQDRPVPDHQRQKINRQISDHCFVQSKDWWTYKLCWGKRLTQFHADASGKLETEYVLGKGPLLEIEDGANDEFLFDVDPANPTRARLIMEWFNGTNCDLTGRPRHAQIFLYCPDSLSSSGNYKNHPSFSAGNSPHSHHHGNNIVFQDGNGEFTVTEQASCEYSVTLRYAPFCEIAELRKKEQAEITVRCIDVTSQQKTSTTEEEHVASSSSSEDIGMVDDSMSVGMETEGEAEEVVDLSSGGDL